MIVKKNNKYIKILTNGSVFSSSLNLKEPVECLCLVDLTSHRLIGWNDVGSCVKSHPWHKWSEERLFLSLCISGSICWWLEEQLQSHSIVQSAVRTPSVCPQHSRWLTDFDPETKTSWSPTWTEWSSATRSWRCSPSQCALGFRQVSAETLKTENQTVWISVCEISRVFVCFSSMFTC